MTQHGPVPEGLAGMLNEGPPVSPRPAASVLLVDPTTSPWQVLMMRRPGSAGFAPGAYVFPGGQEHPEDAETGDPSRGAALRELFEEVGILLGRRADGRFARRGDCSRLNDLLEAGAGWTAALRELRLTPAPDRLVFLARWITPDLLARRFDARFYLARRPAGQIVRPQQDEVAAWAWTTPAAALADGGPTLVHATRRILESVAAEPDVTRLMGRLRRLEETPPVQPRVVRLAGGGFEIVEDPGL